MHTGKQKTVKAGTAFRYSLFAIHDSLFSDLCLSQREGLDDDGQHLSAGNGRADVEVRALVQRHRIEAHQRRLRQEHPHRLPQRLAHVRAHRDDERLAALGALPQAEGNAVGKFT